MRSIIIWVKPRFDGNFVPVCATWMVDKTRKAIRFFVPGESTFRSPDLLIPNWIGNEVPIRQAVSKTDSGYTIVDPGFSWQVGQATNGGNELRIWFHNLFYRGNLRESITQLSLAGCRIKVLTGRKYEPVRLLPTNGIVSPAWDNKYYRYKSGGFKFAETATGEFLPGHGIPNIAKARLANSLGLEFEVRRGTLYVTLNPDSVSRLESWLRDEGLDWNAFSAIGSKKQVLLQVVPAHYDPKVPVCYFDGDTQPVKPDMRSSGIEINIGQLIEAFVWKLPTPEGRRPYRFYLLSSANPILL